MLLIRLINVQLPLSPRRYSELQKHLVIPTAQEKWTSLDWKDRGITRLTVAKLTFDIVKRFKHRSGGKCINLLPKIKSCTSCYLSVSINPSQFLYGDTDLARVFDPKEFDLLTERFDQTMQETGSADQTGPRTR